MKKLFTILALSLIFVGCSSSGEDMGELYFYNWGDYIDEELVGEFESETGIRVISEYYDSNETMYQKLKNSGSNYDLIIPSEYMIEKMIKEDMLEEINYDSIANFQYIEDGLKNNISDPENKYTVPYMYGTLGILYNPTLVSSEINSWDDLWDENYKNNIFMYNSQRDSFAVALKKLGYSMNSTDEGELEEAKKLLIEQKPLVQAYVGDSVKDKMINGEAALAVVYSGDAVFCQLENSDLEYIVPEEGTNYWVDFLAIPKGAENKENAEKFIDFLCRPDIAVRNGNYIGYTTANAEAIKSVDSSLLEASGYVVTMSDKNELFKDLGESIELYNEKWTEVLASE
ncbi:MAG: PotD/PotF family extracellular solute-binding protein [Lachnospirales bacterium]